MSPSGQYVIAQTTSAWNYPQGLNVWDAATGAYQHTVQANSGLSTGVWSHLDLGISQSSGKDVAVVAIPYFSGHRLDNTGTEIYQTERTPDDCWHISAQNYQRPGYAVFGSSGCYNGASQHDRPMWNTITVIPLIEGIEKAIPVAQSRHADGNPQGGDTHTRYQAGYTHASWPAPAPDLSAIAWSSPQSMTSTGLNHALVAEPYCGN